MKTFKQFRRTAVKCLGLTVLIGLAGNVAAQALPPVPEIYMYRGADRDQKLLEGARKEGTVTVYTSLNTKDSIPITEAFEKKYGIKTSLWRASSEKVLNRAIAESRAGRHAADVYETNGPELEAMYREKLLTEFYSPVFKDIPAVAFPAHRNYVADRFNFFVIGYNTNLVKPNEVPNTYEDLLHPRWVGRMGIEAGDSDWFAAIVKKLGEKEGLAYFRKLADQKPIVRNGHTLLAELVAAGEVPMALSVYNQNIERLMQRGAPVKWKAMPPTFGRPNGIAVSRTAPHPHAALLFAEFMLSREGQELIKSRNRVPSSAAVDSSLNKFPYQMIDPVIVLDEWEKWEKLWTALFLKGHTAGKKEEE